MSNTEKQKQALEALHKGVAELLASTAWQDLLTFRNHFHKYSFLNTLLILRQYPNASLVCGYRQWQQLNRYVRKGEKGISILAPIMRKDRDDPDRTYVAGFRQVKVFDLKQTDGELLPTPPTPQILEGNNSLIQRTITALERFCQQERIQLERNLNHPTALGVFRPSTNSISLKPGLPALQELKTLVHEIAHALLHGRNTSIERSLGELEAESTAFLTLQQLGLDTSAYSFPYLANWAADINELITAGDNASKAAAKILNAINSTTLTSGRASVVIPLHPNPNGGQQPAA